MSLRPADCVERLLALDRACVVTLNRALVYRPCTLLARAISRLGNGELWGGLIVVLALLQDRLGPRCALHLAVAAGVGVVIYLVLKRRAGRPRPYVHLKDLHLCAAPLDEFSFPSGHTLHAVAFAIIATAYFPALGLLLVPFAVLTAVARVVLGLHYPSDVLVGAALGGSIAALSLLAAPPV